MSQFRCSLSPRSTVDGPTSPVGVRRLPALVLLLGLPLACGGESPSGSGTTSTTPAGGSAASQASGGATSSAKGGDTTVPPSSTASGTGVGGQAPGSGGTSAQGTLSSTIPRGLGGGGQTSVTSGGTTSAPGSTAARGGTPSEGGAVATGGSSAAGGTTATRGGSSASGGGVSYPYVFSVFDDAAAVSSLQIYTSTDALNFVLLTDTGYTGPTGNLRDPSILKHTDGKYCVAFTTPPSGTGCCGPESSFSIASSADLKAWTTVATVPSGIAGVTNVWAPEWFKDAAGALHILVSIDKKTYRYEPTDSTLTKFGPGTFIGIGPDYIDTFIVYVSGTYHAFTKKESTRFIEHATSASFDGPWTFIGVDDWAGWGTHREGQSLLNLGNGTWRMYCDGGSAGHEMYSDSSDTFKTWTALKALPKVGGVISHGTVTAGN